LERRIAPATFTVTSTGDIGTGNGASGDLRYCITQSNTTAGANTINASGVTGTIILRSGQLAITKSVTIIGPGAGLLSISGNHVSRIFSSSGTGSLSITISGLTLTGGQATGLSNAAYGGAVFVRSGSVTLTDAVLTGNIASVNGGAVYLYTPGASRCSDAPSRRTPPRPVAASTSPTAASRA
jgi:hypothetical protein